jgi:hypothetical protein
VPTTKGRTDRNRLTRQVVNRRRDCTSDSEDFVTLQPDQPWFEAVYVPAPLVIVGTKEPDGSDDLAPKHMAFPLGWSDYFGFVCTPEHSTYRNAERTGVFTVSYPRPKNVLEASLAAAPRAKKATSRLSKASIPLGETPSMRAFLPLSFPRTSTRQRSNPCSEIWTKPTW